MTSAQLTSKRRIQSARNNWSPEVADFIRRPMKLDDIMDENTEQSQCRAQTARTPRNAAPIDSRDRYEVFKKAFDAKQKVRLSQLQKYQDQCDRTERRIRKTKTPQCMQKQKDATDLPVKHMRDKHVIEHIVAQRNDDYMEASEYIPQGYVPNLGSLRKLPPDNKLYVKTSKRVFYWG